MNHHREFGLAVNRLLSGESFAREEMYGFFRRLMLDEETEMHQGAFLAALRAKGETTDEIAAIWKCIYEFDTVKVKPDVNGPLMENSGTGMDCVKTFNVSTAAAIAAAAEGVSMARHGARAITSLCGTVDMVECLGVEVEVEPEQVKKSIEQAGIGIFNGMSASVHPQALGRILSQISFGTVLNIAASLANPTLPQYGVRGVYDPAMLEPVAKLMREIGYKRALVVHGLQADGTPGLDEAGTIGETLFAELKEDGRVERGSFFPEDFHIRRAAPADIAPLPDREDEAVRLTALLAGKAEGPVLDIASLNAGLILYVGGQTPDMQAGFERARECFGAKRALGKLEQWIGAQNKNVEAGLNRMEQLISRI